MLVRNHPNLLCEKCIQCKYYTVLFWPMSYLILLTILEHTIQGYWAVLASLLGHSHVMPSIFIYSLLWSSPRWWYRVLCICALFYGNLIFRKLPNHCKLSTFLKDLHHLCMFSNLSHELPPAACLLVQCCLVLGWWQCQDVVHHSFSLFDLILEFGLLPVKVNLEEEETL